MSPGHVVGIGFAVIGIIGVLLFTAAFLTNRHHRSRYAAVATPRNWKFLPRDDRWTKVFHGSIFQYRRCGAYDVVTGHSDDEAFVAFDFVSRTTNTGVGDNAGATTYDSRHAVTAIHLTPPQKLLEIAPADGLTRAVRSLTRRDTPEGSKEFDRVYTVRGDQGLAEQILTEPVTAHLLAHRGPTYYLDGIWILMATPGHGVPEDIDARVAALRELRSLLPL